MCVITGHSREDEGRCVEAILASCSHCCQGGIWVSVCSVVLCVYVVSVKCPINLT